MSTEAGADGTRRVALLIPFEHEGRRIEHIDIRPLTWGHTQRWEAGHYGGPMELLSELTGLSQSVLDQIRYPDADRVMNEYMAHMTMSIKRDIAEMNMPRQNPLENADEIAPAEEVGESAEEETIEEPPAPGYTELNDPEGRPTPPLSSERGPNWPYPEPGEMPGGEGVDLSGIPGIAMGMDLRDGGHRNKT